MILGTERLDGDRLFNHCQGYKSRWNVGRLQDKVQLDPSEEGVSTQQARTAKYSTVVHDIWYCHLPRRLALPRNCERAVRNGAQVVFHPHTEVVEREDYVPAGFADPTNTCHEKAALCRACRKTLVILQR